MGLTRELALPTMTDDRDLEIPNVRGMDQGTMLEAVFNVDLLDSRFSAITNDKIAGEETSDAKGLAGVLDALSKLITLSDRPQASFFNTGK